MKIQVKPGLEIGNDCLPFIIAEVGSNWKTLEDCIHSIQVAKACGADAVKFQAYDELSLYGIPLDAESIYLQVSNATRDSIRETSLQLEWLRELKSECDRVGIEFMCSAFSPELVEEVDKYVNIHKVASAELTHVRILEKLKEIGKPVILSTGASGEDDIRQALNVLGDTPVILLYCVAAYPARMILLDNIPVMHCKFEKLVGYSDHTVDVLVIPKRAIEKGAVVIEKHVNFTDHTDTPDAPHSLSQVEFKRMVEEIRGGIPFYIGVAPEEQGMVIRHNRRLLATRTIQPGEKFEEGVNFGIYRSLKDDTKALSPWLIDLVNGKQSKIKIEAGDGIGPDAV